MGGEEAVDPVEERQPTMEGWEGARHVEVVYPEVLMLLSPAQYPADCGQGRDVGPASTVGRVGGLRPLRLADEPLAALRPYGSSLEDVTEEPGLVRGGQEGGEVARERL